MCLQTQDLEHIAWALVLERWPADCRGCKPIASLANLRTLAYDTLDGCSGAKQAAASS